MNEGKEESDKRNGKTMEEKGGRKADKEQTESKGNEELVKHR